LVSFSAKLFIYFWRGALWQTLFFILVLTSTAAAAAAAAAVAALQVLCHAHQQGARVAGDAYSQLHA
jgi:Skp family chaperone for outer membrane proteins